MVEDDDGSYLEMAPIIINKQEKSLTSFGGLTDD